MAAGVGHEALNPINPDLVPRLDPKFIDLYNTHVANTPNRPIDLAVLRRVYSTLYGYGTAPAPDCGREYDVDIAGWSKYPGQIKLRIYEPVGTKPAAGWPVHFDFHGGGWGLGDLETEAHICRHICVKAGVVVVDVDYRLVPEFPFPTAIYDCFAAVSHVVREQPSQFGINASIITMGGVSAGGNIAMAVNLLMRDDTTGGLPRVKVVVAGTPTVADISKYARAEDAPYASLKEMEMAPLLNWARLKWFDTLKWDSLDKADAAKREEQERDAAWCRDLMDVADCSGVAELTVVMTAECDPLRDEGEAYAAKLQKAGNRVVVKRFAGVPHPFQHMDAVLDQAKEFIQDEVDYIKGAQA